MKMVNGKPVYSRNESIFSFVCLTGAIALFYFSTFGRDNIVKDDDGAFEACRSQINVIAHPSYAVVPRLDGRPDGPNYYFAWPNGTGISVGGRLDSASCFVNRQTLEITSLTVNGKEQIWRRPESP